MGFTIEMIPGSLEISSPFDKSEDKISPDEDWD
jgi:hypothetical protein